MRFRHRFGTSTWASTDHPHLLAGPPPYVAGRWRLVSAAVPADLIATIAIWRGA